MPKPERTFRGLERLNPTDPNLVEWLNEEVEDYRNAQLKDFDHLAVFTAPLFYVEIDGKVYTRGIPTVDFKALRRKERVRSLALVGFVALVWALTTFVIVSILRIL
jgi:hypothetical protein